MQKQRDTASSSVLREIIRAFRDVLRFILGIVAIGSGLAGIGYLALAIWLPLPALMTGNGLVIVAIASEATYCSVTALALFALATLCGFGARERI